MNNSIRLSLSSLVRKAGFQRIPPDVPVKTPIIPAAKPAAKAPDPQSQGRRISIACFPKSGSTFITKSLSSFTGFPTKIIVTSAENQELAMNRLKRAALEPSFITQSHILPTKHNLKMLEDFGMDTVFLSRDIMDCLISLRDMYVERVETGEGIWKGSFNSQWGYYDHRFLALSQSEQYDYIIECAAPWYLQCYAGWKIMAAKNRYPMHFVRYEEFFADPDENFKKLAGTLDLASAEKLAAFSLPSKTAGAQGVRFNVGRVGRGRELFSKAQQDRIMHIAKTISTATGCDFSEVLSD